MGQAGEKDTTINLNWTELDEQTVTTIRTLSMDAVQAANSGHPGTPMALAHLGWLIFSRFLRHNPKDPHWVDRDRFILSCGHASMLAYSLLHLSGYDLTLDDLKNFRQWMSRTPGHPEYGDAPAEYGHTPGIETTTGPLGQGFGMGVGMGLAERLLSERFNQAGADIVDHRVFVLCSDGDVMEGLSHEAASLAGHLRLGKLIYCWDDNHITIDGETELAFSEDVLQRFAAYGWHTASVDNGQDVEAICAAIQEAIGDERPSMIRVRTHIAWGAPTKQDTAEAHGAPLGEDEVRATKEVYGVDPDSKFLVTSEVAAYARKKMERGRQLQEQWQQRFEAWKSANAELAKEWQRCWKRGLPEGIWDLLPDFSGEKKMATRKASGAVINALAPKLPELVAGSADLTDSNNTRIKGEEPFSAKEARRNIHYGVREHAMGAAINGMALHGGLRPFGGTFFIFSDYMRPAIRLAALQKAHSLFVFTHDSIGLGEDGPTHQPVEHLASLRAMPHLTVIRPADAAETAQAWRVALEHEGGPVALVLTRQDVPVLDRSQFASAEGLRKGAYVLAEGSTGNPEVVLMGTGSEVQLCVAAREILEGEGVVTRVVSLPSWELFEAQPAEYRNKVLPPQVVARVSVEAAASFGWSRYIGDSGVAVALDRFGASAPADVVFRELGFTAQAVVQAARKSMEQARR